jgi:CotH kinase protein
MNFRFGMRLGQMPHVIGALLGSACAIAACSSDAPKRASSTAEAAVPEPPATGAPSNTPVEPKTPDSPNPPEPEAPRMPAVYDPDTIPHFELTLDAAAVAILSSPNSDDKTTWVHGAFKYGNVTFADVGVRRKGSYSLRALPQKTSLKIKFNKWVKGQKLDGLEELTINNNLSDHTYLEQRVAFHIFRAMGLPAMYANAAQLTINGEDYGLYTNVETPDENFLARVFGTNARTLYEAHSGGEWLPGSDDRWELDIPDPNAPAGTKPDLDALFQAVAASNDATLLADLEGHLHTQHFLRYCATEAITGQHDGYAYGFYDSDNYFMSGDKNGKFSLIPWSTDTTFVASSGKDIDVSKPQPTVVLARCSRSATCWNAYKTEMQSALALYETLDLVNLAKKWHAQIDTIAKADPKRETSTSFYESQTERMYQWIANRPQVIRAQLGLE